MTAKNIKVCIYRGNVPAIGPGVAVVLGGIKCVTHQAAHGDHSHWCLPGRGTVITEFSRDVLERCRALETKATQSVLKEL